jgi:PTH1 family peptidyl-tRNA hydrolase
VSSWVLNKASNEDQTAIEASIESAISALPLLLDGDAVKAMTVLHSENHQPPPNNED